MRVITSLGASAIVLLSSLPALAQSDGVISNADIERYAEVVLAIEPHRQEALNLFNSATGDVERAAIRREFIRTAADIIEAAEMTVTDYNQITIQLRDDLTLKSRVEEAIRTQQL